MTAGVEAEIRRRIEAALGQIIGEVEGGFVSRWSVVIESAEANGERGVWIMAPADAKSWDTLGMLNYAVAVEQARIVRDQFAPDG